MNEQNETSDPVTRLRQVWDDYELGREKRRQGDQIVNLCGRAALFFAVGILIVIIVMTLAGLVR
jgi:hypothetical protein